MTEPADNPQGSPPHDPWETIGEAESPAPPENAPRSKGFQPVPGDPPPTSDEGAGVSASNPNGIELLAEIPVPALPDPEPKEPAHFGGDISHITPVSDSPPVDHTAKARLIPSSGGGWTIPILCAGLCIIACCVLIPQADANRRLAYQKRVLEMDLDSIKQQVALNDVFLQRVADDPTLAERLAQRQMKIIRAGTRVLPMKDSPGTNDMSPFQLVSVAPPAPLPPYHPMGGIIAGLCYNVHTRLYLTGAGLLLVAVGLVLGAGGNAKC